MGGYYFHDKMNALSDTATYSYDGVNRLGNAAAEGKLRLPLSNPLNPHVDVEGSHMNFINNGAGGNLHVTWKVNTLVEKLMQLLNRRVRFVFSDGEVLVGDLEFVIPEDDSVIFELVSSNRPDKYENCDVRPTGLGKISEIVECDLDKLASR